MFEGDGFGVGLTMQFVGLDAMPPSGSVPPEVSVRPSRLGELRPAAERTSGQLAAELGRIVAAEAQLAAYRAELVCALARQRPDADDRVIGQPGAASPDWVEGVEHPKAGVSEFFLDELAMALGTSKTSAGYIWRYDAALREQLPGTWAALADGELDWPRGRAIAAVVSALPDTVSPVVIAAVETAVLPRAGELTVTALKAAVRAELLAHGALDADHERRDAALQADAYNRPTRHGRADFGASLTVEDAAACWDVADQIARAARAGGDTRPLGVIRAEVVRDRVLRPTDPEQDAVTARLEVTAGLDALERAAGTGEPCADPCCSPVPNAAEVDTEAAGSDATAAQPGETTEGTQSPIAARPAVHRQPIGAVNGQPITAEHLRTFLEKIDALCPGGLQPPTDGSLALALTDPDGSLRAVLTRPQLERLVRRGCPTHPPDAHCRCPVVDRPPPVDRYRPSAAQDEFTRTRDRRCRMPACSARAGWADVDHVVAHGAGGATDCSNLCCLCRRHHRLKTFARGWTFALADDGTLTVTTPSGVTRITRPPGQHDPPPAGIEAGVTDRGEPVAAVGGLDPPPF